MEIVLLPDAPPSVDITFPVTDTILDATLRQAIVAVEDERFFQHGGIDLNGVLRAVVENMRAGRIVQGGSTLTQQLVRVAQLTPTRTFERKIRRHGEDTMWAFLPRSEPQGVARYGHLEGFEGLRDVLVVGQRAPHGERLQPECLRFLLAPCVAHDARGDVRRWVEHDRSV